MRNSHISCTDFGMNYIVEQQIVDVKCHECGFRNQFPINTGMVDYETAFEDLRKGSIDHINHLREENKRLRDNMKVFESMLKAIKRDPFWDSQ